MEGQRTLSLNQFEFLARLPLLLNSFLSSRVIIGKAIEELKRILKAEAATVFILEEGGGGAELTFWALQGGECGKLEGVKMPSDKGIVGWVINKQESVHVTDASKDSRFFSEIDSESKFKTRDLLCVPLTVRGSICIGALQVLNSMEPSGFLDQDLMFLEQFAGQLSLAFDNARLYESLLEKTQKLETLEKRKNEMISIITHEFRTPLGVIQSSADMLSSNKIKDESAQKRMSDVLIRGVERLTRLVSQVKDLSLVSNKLIQLERRRVFVADVFQRILTFFAEPLKARKLDLSTTIGKNVEYVDADLSLLILVFEKLVSNAIRFTPDGGQISLLAQGLASMVVFEVKDTGIGIEEGQIDLIFDKFYSVGDAMLHSSGQYEFKSGGLGLGLAMVKAVLKAHGSSIEVESTPGAGSSFRFCMPRG